MARTPAATREFLRIARARYEQGRQASEKQRRRELDDLKFYSGQDGAQWDPEQLKARQAQQASAGMPPVPARPCLQINKVREPVHQVLNQERLSDMSVELVAADDFGGLPTPIDETEIDLREGIVRRIQRESDAADARTWAFTRAVIAGQGFYAVATRYLPGKTWDQEVYVRMIYNQAAVMLDPAHEQPDGSDCDWEFIGTDLPWSVYKDEHRYAKDGGKNPICDADDETFRALGEEYPGWFTTEKDTKSVRVVEYYYTERELRTLVLLKDGTSAWKDELPENTEFQEERDVVQKSIQFAKIDATQILEETELAGPDMPVIKVLGEQLQPYDSEKRAEGMVRPSRDAQQGFNAMVSKWVETVGLAPIPPWLMAEGQAENYEAWYQAANTRTIPYLYFKQTDLMGQPAPPPQRVNVDTPIQAIAASVQLFDEAIKSTTMVPSVQLGQATDPHLKSGRAIKLMQDQAQIGTSNYLDNLRRSIRCEGKIINNLLYPIYGAKPGRLVRIMTGEGESQTMQIGPPSTTAPMGMPGMPPSGQPKTYQLTKDAQFNVIVKVSRGFESRRQELSSDLLDLVQAQPQMMAIFGDLLFKNMDWPGHQEMAERMEAMLDPKIQALQQAQKQGQDIPPQAMAQIAQLQAQLQHAEQILGQAKQELEQNTAKVQAEQQSKVQLAQIEFDKAIELQKMKDATQLEVARIGAAKQAADAAAEMEEESIALAAKLHHEAEQSQLQREHEQRMTQQAQAHQARLAASKQISVQRDAKGTVTGFGFGGNGEPSRPQ